MSSFIETTEQATTDIQDVTSKRLSQLKIYTFFIFYDIINTQSTNPIALEKMNFNVKQEKNNSNDNNQSNTEKIKQIEIHFYDFQNYSAILHAISDIRNHSAQNKAKIIINASEERLSYLIHQFDNFKIDISSIPILINSNQFQSDISVFLGWKTELKQNIASKSIQYFRGSSEDWIKAAPQKIDVWLAEITVNQQKGEIFKLQNNKLVPILDKKKVLKQYFVSHICIGYHASLLLKCKEKFKTNDETVGNGFISFIQRFKKFCCVGEKNMKETTGIANIHLVDEKGEQLQILKQLKQPDSSEEESQNDFKAAKYKQYKDVLSILMTNLNIYQGNTLDKSIQGKVYDGKLQLLTFDSQRSHRKICSSGGQIKIRMQAEEMDVQIGESLYRIKHPEQIRINFSKKIKVGIHNQVVKC